MTIPNDAAEQTAMNDALKNPFENIPGQRDVSVVARDLGDSRGQDGRSGKLFIEQMK